MTAQEALNILINQTPEYKQGYKVLECLDYDKFFAFAMVPDTYDGKGIGGGYDTVDKEKGQIGVLNPTDDFDLFFREKWLNRITQNKKNGGKRKLLKISRKN